MRKVRDHEVGTKAGGGVQRRQRAFHGFDVVVLGAQAEW